MSSPAFPASRSHTTTALKTVPHSQHGRPLSLATHLTKSPPLATASSRLGATCEIQRLDWHAPPPEGGGEKFEVVIGSDVGYYEEDAVALASTAIRATAPGGKFLLMNRVGTDKRSAALEKV